MGFRKGRYIGVSNGITRIVNNRKIKICHNITHTLFEYIQKDFFSKEAGGILIGKENKSNENIIINNITVPMPKDERKHNRFIRKDRGHIRLFENLYKESDETLRYIGEWHTHSEAIPDFSCIDLKNWKKICKASNVYDNYYHIIVGYEAIRIWEINNTFQVRLINTILWKDVGGN